MNARGAAAAYVLTFLTAEIERLVAKFKNETATTGRADLNDYRLGASRAIQLTLSMALSDRRRAEQNHSTGTALVVRKRELVAEKFDISYSNRAAKKERHSDAAFAGYRYGRNVRLQTGVANQNADRAAVR